MILYNVTINVEDQLHDEWLDWMLNEHIPKVMESGMFLTYKMFRIISRISEEETGTTYSVQYFADTLDKYDIYRNVYAPALQQQSIERFGANMPMAFRTVLEEV